MAGVDTIDPSEFDITGPVEVPHVVNVSWLLSSLIEHPDELRRFADELAPVLQTVADGHPDTEDELPAFLDMWTGVMKFVTSPDLQERMANPVPEVRPDMGPLVFPSTELPHP